ncbi:DNA-binding transcriptional regulator GbsR, MarR family [Amycolatopsis arida]|uniref:DNA-binding transcriptional regulator GbsR, MarR family n=1 Tax=Amycolatopsis arida TaxID=587909 RepID=A0A1I5SHS7_9PSEU|nr:MarR family transcriptional regulator [Amycolatopsis arida]TDX96475.1 DNA-binding transcriptional regulator GbsR (MarR family) [Amycolatopsis arida]SFP70047.1 DNA-binding transcriptional regulator GbsR, MarR family [Amycolatopsis arida]
MSSRPYSQRDPGVEGADGGAVERDEDAVRRYVESLALVLTQIGFQRMAARVFATLMVTDSGQATAAELASRLSVSPAAISGAVRFLEQLGMVAKVREPGERRDHYRLYDDLWYSSFLKRDRMIMMWRDATVDGIRVLGRDTPAGKRLADMCDFLEFMIRELPALFERWRRQHEEAERRAG